MKRDSVVLGIATGVMTAVSLTAAAVWLLLSGTWLYRLEMSFFRIPETSGYPAEMILENYRAVIRYLSPFSKGAFAMPDLPASEGGAQHFKEVRAIVMGLYLAGILALLLLLWFRIGCRACRGPKSRITAAVTALALPALILAGVAADFDGAFVLFHRIFFANDFWIFDAVTDPVITILPAGYFAHCAVVIAVFWILGSLFLFWSCKRHQKHRETDLPDGGRLSFGKPPR